MSCVFRGLVGDLLTDIWVSYYLQGIQCYNINEYWSYAFYLVGRGQLPPSDGTDGQEPHMFIPVLPNRSHPTSREPIQPSETGRLFPWNDCYISIAGTVQGRCATTNTDEEQQYVVPLSEMSRIQDLLEDDRARARELFEIQNPGKRYPPFPMLPDYLQEDLDDEDSHGYSHSLQSTNPDTDVDPDENVVTDPNADILVHMLLNTAPDTMVVVDLTPNLSTVDTVNDPKGFFEEMDALKKSVDSSPTPIA